MACVEEGRVGGPTMTGAAGPLARGCLLWRGPGRFCRYGQRERRITVAKKDLRDGVGMDNLSLKDIFLAELLDLRVPDTDVGPEGDFGEGPMRGGTSAHTHIKQS